MKNKKINFIKVGLIFAFASLSATVIRADVITTTIPYVDDDGVKSVNIEDLTRALKGKVIENESSIDIFLNDSILSIYPESGSAFLDGDLIPLKTKKIKVPHIMKLYIHAYLHIFFFFLRVKMTIHHQFCRSNILCL